MTVLLTFLYGGALSYSDTGIPGLSVDGGREHFGEVWASRKGEAVQGKWLRMDSLNWLVKSQWALSTKAILVCDTWPGIREE